MRGFRFRLEKLRDLRTAEEQGKARALAKARDAVARLESVIDGVVDSEAGVLERIGTMLQGGPRAGAVQNMQVMLGQLRRQRAVAEVERVKAQEELNAALLAYQDAFREREILDRLRARQMDSWNRDEQRREQAVLDEVGRHQGKGFEKGVGS